MNLYQFSGRIFRFVLAAIVLVSVTDYIHESTFDIKCADLVKNIVGDYSVQIDEIDVKLALNDSTFMIKIDA